MSGQGRISRGWRLTRVAWTVLLHDRTALLLAGLQALAGVAVAVAVFTLSGWVSHPGQESRLLLAVLITYLPSTVISTFIGVALCAAVAAAMEGGHLSISEALAVPTRRIGQVLLWSLLATGVGLLLEQLAARLPFATRVVTWLAGMAWPVGTLFVLPILALNGCDAPECVRQSARLVKQRWGEGVTGNLVIGAWAVVLMIPLAIAVGIVDAATHSRAATWLAYLAVIVVVSSVTSAASRVFSVALYRYATDTGTTGPFPDADLRQPFRKARTQRSSNGGAEATGGHETSDSVSRPTRWHRLRLALFGVGVILVGGVYVANVVAGSRHPHHPSGHLGPDHGVVFGLLVIIGFLLLLASGLVHLWIKRSRRLR